MIPPLIASVSGSLLGGIIMQRTGKYYRLTICSLALSVLGSIIIFLSAGIFQFSWGLIIGLCFSALGIGSTITTTLISVIANIDPKDQAIATACTYLFRSLGSVVGVSLGSTLVQQVLRRRLRAGLDSGSEADKIVERVRQSLDFIKELEPHTRAIVMRCYEKATTAAFGLTIAYMSMALIASFWIRETKLSR
jgi:MFS family permease